MSAARYDFVIVGRRVRGQRARQPAERGRHRRTRCSCLEAGRHGLPAGTCYIHMPAALAVSRSATGFYDWKYESEPEPVDGRPADLPRAREGARGIEQHQWNDLPARQPAGLRALGDRSGHGDVGLCPLPSLFQEDGDVPRRRRTLARPRGPARARARARHQPALLTAFFEAVQQAGYRLTDDVNGYRQEGFALFDRNVHRGRRLSAARAYLYPVIDPPNLRIECRAFVNRIVFDGTRAVGVDYRRGREGTLRSCGTVTATASHTLRLVASGTSTVTLSIYVDGVASGTVTDSSSPYTIAGPGFGLQGDGTAADSTVTEWQDFASSGISPSAKPIFPPINRIGLTDRLSLMQ